MATTTMVPQASSGAAIMLEAELRGRIDGEVRFDRTSRMLYSTDASNYQIEPVGVVIPKHNDDVHAAVELAAKYGISILPRGGGSALAGQTVGHSLVIDFSKYMDGIIEINPEERSVRVQPGINLDLLNTRLKPHGLMFGPDPSSGNRATIGGVVANNSSGAHSILYGMTSDHVQQATVLLADGSKVLLDPTTVERAGQDDATGRLMAKLLAFQEKHSPIIARDFPRHWRRATGYSLDQFLKPDFNPARVIVSSEGTLATTLEATLGLVPTPTKTALALLQFADLVEAMAATTSILEVQPSAIELMDRMLIELTRQQPGYASQIAFIKGNPEAVLAVEFYGETDEELRAQLDKLEWHLRTKGLLPESEMLRAMDPKQQADVWSVRKAGLGLLMSIRGDAKPIPCIEDVSVPVEHLAEYVAEIKRLCADHGTVAAYYAHASAGCLHIRPLIDLKQAEGIDAMDAITLAATDLARRFGGVMSGEHGDGLQRSELNEQIFGPELYGAMRELKGIFDPAGIMNPGKVVDAPAMSESLRYGVTYRAAAVRTYLDFSREGGFDRAIEMCNGAGVCRKIGAGTMCPSYMATRDEMDTTRARANALRNALAGRMFAPEELTSREVYDVLDLCISCKACKTECPSSVDMAKIKAEWLAHYYDEHGVDRRTRMFASVHQSSKLAARFPKLANAAMSSPPGRAMLTRLGVHPERTLSSFADQTFEAWWREHQRKRDADGSETRPVRGQVVYFHDTFATYNYPRVGRAVVRLLEAAGFEVFVETRRACCGRPMLSKGLIEDARRVAKRNIEVLAPYARRGIPIVGSEPSCILTLRDEYIDLLPEVRDAQIVAEHAFMIDEYLERLARTEELGIAWRAAPRKVLFHGHCHQKALVGMAPSMSILQRAGIDATESGAGCCGMAGSFGYETEHYEVSRKIGEERLFPRVRAASADTVIAVAGVSCRQQIEHFTGRRVRHIAEVLAEQVQPGHVWRPMLPDVPVAAD
jgi:FAD/FMN-containing dehydrogenase/Fe-S oxidoreductase